MSIKDRIKAMLSRKKKEPAPQDVRRMSLNEIKGMEARPEAKTPAWSYEGWWFS